MTKMTCKRQKWDVKLFIIALLLIISSSSVVAMGVGPSRQVISYSPGETFEGELIIINDARQEFKAGIYPQGDLADNIKISTPLVDVSSSDAMKSIPYSIEFPSESPTPGQHKLEVVVRQFPPDTAGAEGTTVSATMALIAQIIIKVPYPGKFAEGKLFVSGTETLETPVRFGMTVYNFGTEQIDDAKVNVEVFSPSNQRVADLNTDSKSVKPKQETDFLLDWKPDVEKGAYKAVATFNYDDKEFVIEQDFNLGSFVIDVSEITVDKFRLGDVAKFDILLFNSWNTELKDVFVEMLVTDSTGKKMTEVKTATVNIPAQQAEQVEAYWYTEGVPPGIYTVKLLVHYAGKITQKEYEFEVSTNSITRLDGAVGRVTTTDGTEEVTSQGVIILLILIVLVLLVGMNVVWFYFLSKKLKMKGGDK